MKRARTSEALRPLLACPVCGSALDMSADGAHCAKHGLFPAHGGLLSFVSDSLDEFDSHWESAEAARPKAKAEAARRFLAPVFEAESVAKASLTVLDVGCGDGVHIQQLLADGGRFRVAGLDYSARALASALQLKGDWLPVHADAQHIPFGDNSFDVVISFGVQAYLPDPDRGFAELVRVTRPGGLIGVWYAPPRKGPAGMLFSLTRSLVPRLPAWAQIAVANTLVPFLGLMPTASTLSLRTGTWSECREVILVNIAPRHIVFPTRKEIEGRFLAYGCELTTKPDAIEGEYWARKDSA